MDWLDAHPHILALAIFLMRLSDVSLGTVRTILVVRGYRVAAVVMAFFEVLLWVLAVSQVLRRLDQWFLMLSYAGGFAAGNYVGMWLEARLALGTELLRAISHNPAIRLAELLRGKGHDVTELAGRGSNGAPVEVLLIVERRRRIPVLLEHLREADPEALCTLSDVRHPPATPRPPRSRLPFAGILGAGKRK